MNLRVALVALILPCGALAIQQPDLGTATQGSAFSPLQDAVALNNLCGKGKPPFHLKLSFQINDLSGKPEEQGTVDEWWAGPEGSYIEVAAPSFGKVHDLQAGGLPDDEARRSLYLVRELLNVVRAPYGSVPSEGKLVSLKQTEGKVVMDCMYVRPKGSNGQASDYTMACVDEPTRAIRIVNNHKEVSLRNQPATFGSTHVALESEVLFLNRIAITGHIDSLESFDPANAPVSLEKPSPQLQSVSFNACSAALPVDQVVPSRRISGASLNKFLPDRNTPMTAAVVLAVHINQSGAVEEVVPLASTDAIAMSAALEAIRTFKYQPATLNGKPVASDIVVDVAYH